ncbi:helix-turn-helix domain-containing protein [Nocardioides sp.]|uniref:sigma-54-dependent Fis family transcriptional regulator n=1 Tax=Nocardioides sp. TaxID=35761 RepID=UPI0031FEE239|nr:Fis family transcriptional regulator [Nocardioides sp.]
MATQGRGAAAQDLGSVSRARDAFLSHDDPRKDEAIRNPIRLSWQRSEASLVDADHPAPSYFERADAETTLARAARPVLKSLSAELAGEPACLILTDAKGIVMERGGGDGSLLRHLDAVDLAPGFQYSETEVGTNGIGTALEVGAPILVNGDEHYTGSLRGFSCAGALVTHPVTGALLGVVDITTKAENTNSLLLSFAKLAARRIQERILEEANELDRGLLGDYYAACRHTGGSVIAIGGEVFMMNALAQQHFDANDQAALIDQTRDARGRTTPYTLMAELPSGVTARLAYQPSFVGDALAGGIIQVKEQRASARSSGSTHAPALPGVAGGSALWRHVTQEVLDACGRVEWLVVEGEAGVGKTSVLRAAHQHVSPTRSLAVLDAADPEGDFLDRATTALESGSDVIICHAHLLHAEALDGLSEMLQEVHNNAVARAQWVALTVEPSDVDDALGLSLLRLFPRTVAVPPLRHHLEDVPALVRALLNRAGVPSLALSASALNQLMRLPWAGNVTHLRTVLIGVSRKRRSGTIEVQDLPAECHATTRRQLTKMESLERDAIVDALAAHGGDKAAASAAVGMSRATIYRKIRDYGIVS